MSRADGDCSVGLTPASQRRENSFLAAVSRAMLFQPLLDDLFERFGGNRRLLKDPFEILPLDRTVHSRFICATCGQMFDSEEALDAHNREMHPEKQQGPTK